jgi:hypothetical protein
MYSLVLPFHSDYKRLVPTLEQLKNASQKFGIKEILLCHNGPNLEALEAARGYETGIIRVFHTSEKGIGAAYRLGILNATQANTILSASDLPFGFSDVESFENYKNEIGNYPDLAIGSKFHLRSEISSYQLSRKIYSRIFYILRVLILGFSTPKDSQGTILGSTEILRRLEEKTISRDYFFSLEILSIAIAQSINVIELPIQLTNHDQESSVAPVNDGLSMMKRLLELRRRLT